MGSDPWNLQQDISDQDIYRQVNKCKALREQSKEQLAVKNHGLWKPKNTRSADRSQCISNLLSRTFFTPRFKNSQNNNPVCTAVHYLRSAQGKQGICSKKAKPQTPARSFIDQGSFTAMTPLTSCSSRFLERKFCSWKDQDFLARFLLPSPIFSNLERRSQNRTARYPPPT